MRPIRIVSSRHLLLLSLLVIFAPRASAQPAMSDLWPNDDGHKWQYEQVYHDFYYGEQVQNQVRFFFDGADVVPGGITVQNLVIEVLDPPLGAPSLAGLADAPAAADPFLRNLWRARPDLRTAIARKLSADSIGAARYVPGYYQLLIGDGAYRKSDEEIAMYRRDLDATKAWLLLVQDLTIGSTFELQLVPDIADDVWLYGTVAAWEDVDVPAGHFDDCLRVDYLVDYGESICTDDTGAELGGSRAETRGFIHYGPGVGPVDHQEEFVPFVQFTWGVCPGWEGYEGVVITSGSLRLVSNQPTGVESTTWGRIKAAYR